MRTLGFILFLAMWAGLPRAALADATKVYPHAELARDAPRFTEKFQFIYERAVVPKLTPGEQRALQGVRFEHPYPRRADSLLNFYSGVEAGRRTVWLPLLSTKLVEDLATAYAWLWDQNLSFDTIDLYAAMLRWKEPSEFAGGHYPAPRSALGIPSSALDRERVDGMSLRIRNSAWAFILLHELGHLRHGHRPYAGRPLAEGHANEIEADRFALDVLERTGTIPMGAILFFQAQAYSLPNEGQFADAAAWQEYLERQHTHPLSTQRLVAIAQHMGAAASRASDTTEGGVLRGMAADLVAVAEILEDPVLQRCIAAVARGASASSLAPRRAVAGDQMQRWCSAR